MVPQALTRAVDVGGLVTGPKVRPQVNANEIYRIPGPRKVRVHGHISVRIFLLVINIIFVCGPVKAAQQSEQLSVPYGSDRKSPYPLVQLNCRRAGDTVN